MTEAKAMKTLAEMPPSRPAGPRRRRGRSVALTLIGLAAQAGCGREFYREWANQDVSEAVFEKSRDPRFRLDLFSIDPPALSRFADPYDPDRPPAPPDDYATQAVSPVPQWPDHRLMMPVEGTGYLRLLDDGPRYEGPKPKPSRTTPIVVPNPDRSQDGAAPPPGGGTSPFAPSDPNPKPPGTPVSPFVPDVPNNGRPATPGPGVSRTNSGPGDAAMSPTYLAAKAPPVSPPTATPPGATTRPASKPAGPGAKDDGVRKVAMQDPAPPMTTATPNQPIPAPITRPPSTTTAPGDPLRTPQITGDPNPTDVNLAAPNRLRSAEMNPDVREIEANTASLARMFVPEDISFDEAVQAGLRAGSKPYVVTMEKAFQVALLNARVYQFQLENVYAAALPVTLLRFSFSPQFIAGLSPTTGIAGAGNTFGTLTPAQNPVTSFLYQTRATGNQVSTLNYGSVAGAGKLFDNGTRILASFATQLIFNFVGKNPTQPTVRSYLPLQMVVPFLRGGGRALTLEGLTQAERNLVYQVRSFAKFRQEFVVSTLVAGQVQNFGTTVPSVGFTGGGNADTVIGFLNVVEDVQLLENTSKNLATFERIAEVYLQLIEGESSGLSRLQLDQVLQQVQNARVQVLQSRLNFRNDLDGFKQQLGMPPDTPMIVDRSRTAPFNRVFEEIDRWSLTERRELGQLAGIIAKLPDLEDLVLDGRSCHDVFDQKDDPNLENLLLIAERVALENRLDLMNVRAGLYDAWRQIRVSANALKGVLGVTLTNQFLTPPTTNNPFGFVDQAKQFSLVINAELPLVRVAERNAFRTALINYQRQRRALQNAEDSLKQQLRQEIRQLQFIYQTYKIAERNLVLSIRQKDQALEQIIAPPQGNAAGGNQAALQTTNLIQFQASVLNNENNLVTLWYQYQSLRLQIYRDLGTLPYDEWEAFDEIFPPDRVDAGLSAAVDREGRPAVARAVVGPAAAAGAARAR